MEADDVQKLYGGAYAASYNDIWQHSGRWEAEADHHLRSLRELVTPTTRWLDAGCGTGWNLSHFAGVERTGIDLSPDMLAEARAANPDATFRQGDLRDDVEEWHGAWDLVTCTGQPWSYVDTMAEIEAVLTNLALWTAPTGTCFLPMGDLSDLTGQELPLRHPGDPLPDDAPVIDAVVWSLWEHDRHHRAMIWPSVSWCIEVLARHFARIEVVRWPLDPPWLPIARRVLVASRRRSDGDETPLELVEHPIPDAFVAGPSGDAPAGSSDEPEPTEPDMTTPGPEAASETTATSPEASVPAPDVSPPLSERLPGGLLDQRASYLLGRLRPWTPAFWRSVSRRVRR